jgi:hypothetical protein
MKDLEKVFSNIYKQGVWKCGPTVSGKGSTVRYTTNFRAWLEGIIRDYNVRTVFDAGCGDFHWMRYVNLDGADYIGWDVVPSMVKRDTALYGNSDRHFYVGDITEPHYCGMPDVDLIICRSVFYHLSLHNIDTALDNFRRSGSRLLVATTHPDVAENVDSEDGGWRKFNLALILGQPVGMIKEGPDHNDNNEHAGLWVLNPPKESA